MPKKYWIPKNIKKGALSHQLGIPESAVIPIGLLSDIKHAEIGTTIHNRYNIGKPVIKITKLLKQRAVMSHTLKVIGGSRVGSYLDI